MDSDTGVTFTQFLAGTLIDRLGHDKAFECLRSGGLLDRISFLFLDQGEGYGATRHYLSHGFVLPSSQPESGCATSLYALACFASVLERMRSFIDPNLPKLSPKLSHVLRFLDPSPAALELGRAFLVAEFALPSDGLPQHPSYHEHHFSKAASKVRSIFYELGDILQAPVLRVPQTLETLPPSEWPRADDLSKSEYSVVQARGALRRFLYVLANLLAREVSSQQCISSPLTACSVVQRCEHCLLMIFGFLTVYKS